MTIVIEMQNAVRTGGDARYLWGCDMMESFTIVTGKMAMNGGDGDRFCDDMVC